MKSVIKWTGKQRKKRSCLFQEHIPYWRKHRTFALSLSHYLAVSSKWLIRQRQINELRIFWTASYSTAYNKIIMLLIKNTINKNHYFHIFLPSYNRKSWACFIVKWAVALIGYVTSGTATYQMTKSTYNEWKHSGFKIRRILKKKITEKW
jgi:hypothetical protein